MMHVSSILSGWNKLSITTRYLVGSAGLIAVATTVTIIARKALTSSSEQPPPSPNTTTTTSQPPPTTTEEPLLPPTTAISTTTQQSWLEKIEEERKSWVIFHDYEDMNQLIEQAQAGDRDALITLRYRQGCELLETLSLFGEDVSEEEEAGKAILKELATRYGHSKSALTLAKDLAHNNPTPTDLNCARDLLRPFAAAGDEEAKVELAQVSLCAL